MGAFAGLEPSDRRFQTPIWLRLCLHLELRQVPILPPCALLHPRLSGCILLHVLSLLRRLQDLTPDVKKPSFTPRPCLRASRCEKDGSVSNRNRNWRSWRLHCHHANNSLTQATCRSSSLGSVDMEGRLRQLTLECPAGQAFASTACVLLCLFACHRSRLLMVNLMSGTSPSCRFRAMDRVFTLRPEYVQMTDSALLHTLVTRL